MPELKFPFIPKFKPNGELETDPRYREILHLHHMLTADNVPHSFEKMHDGWHIEYPCRYVEGGRVCSVVQHFGSYGHQYDLLEIMGLLTPGEDDDDESVLGWLTAEDVYLRIVSHYQNTQEAARVEKEEQ